MSNSKRRKNPPALWLDVELSTGSIVTHRPIAVAVTEAYVETATGPRTELTDAEWQEYCGVLKARRRATLARVA